MPPTSLSCASNGDRATFYRTLEQGGVSRQRLQSFERPIKTDPEFYARPQGRPDRRIRELPAHSEVGAFGDRSGKRRGGGARPTWQGLASEDRRACSACGSATRRSRNRRPRSSPCREELAGLLETTADDPGLRDLLYLDLALEEVLRGAVERQELSRFDRDRLVGLLRAALAQSRPLDGCRRTGPVQSPLGRPAGPAARRPGLGSARQERDRSHRPLGARRHRRNVPAPSAQGRVPGCRLRGAGLGGAAVQRGSHSRRPGVSSVPSVAAPRSALAESRRFGRLASRQPGDCVAAGSARSMRFTPSSTSISLNPRCLSPTASAAMRKSPRTSRRSLPATRRTWFRTWLCRAQCASAAGHLLGRGGLPVAQGTRRQVAGPAGRPRRRFDH